MATRRSLLGALCAAALSAAPAFAVDLPMVKKSGRLRVLAVLVNEGPQFIGAGKPDDMVTRFLTTLQREPDGNYRIVGDASFLAAPGDWEKLKPVTGLHFDD